MVLAVGVAATSKAAKVPALYCTPENGAAKLFAPLNIVNRILSVSELL